MTPIVAPVWKPEAEMDPEDNTRRLLFEIHEKINLIRDAGFVPQGKASRWKEELEVLERLLDVPALMLDENDHNFTAHLNPLLQAIIVPLAGILVAHQKTGIRKQMALIMLSEQIKLEAFLTESSTLRTLMCL